MAGLASDFQQDLFLSPPLSLSLSLSLSLPLVLSFSLSLSLSPSLSLSLSLYPQEEQSLEEKQLPGEQAQQQLSQLQGGVQGVKDAVQLVQDKVEAVDDKVGRLLSQRPTSWKKSIRKLRVKDALQLVSRLPSAKQWPKTVAPATIELEDFDAWMVRERNLAPSTRCKHLLAMRRVLGMLEVQLSPGGDFAPISAPLEHRDLCSLRTHGGWEALKRLAFMAVDAGWTRKTWQGLSVYVTFAMSVVGEGLDQVGSSGEELSEEVEDDRHSEAHLRCLARLYKDINVYLRRHVGKAVEMTEHKQLRRSQRLIGLMGTWLSQAARRDLGLKCLALLRRLAAISKKAIAPVDSTEGEGPKSLVFELRMPERSLGVKLELCANELAREPACDEMRVAANWALGAAILTRTLSTRQGPWVKLTPGQLRDEVWGAGKQYFAAPACDLKTGRQYGELPCLLPPDLAIGFRDYLSIPRPTLGDADVWNQPVLVGPYATQCLSLLAQKLCSKLSPGEPLHGKRFTSTQMRKMLMGFQADEPRASRCSADVSAWLYQSLFAILVEGQSPKVAYKHYRQIPLDRLYPPLEQSLREWCGAVISLDEIHARAPEAQRLWHGILGKRRKRRAGDALDPHELAQEERQLHEDLLAPPRPAQRRKKRRRRVPTTSPSVPAHGQEHPSRDRYAPHHPRPPSPPLHRPLPLHPPSTPDLTTTIPSPFDRPMTRLPAYPHQEPVLVRKRLKKKSRQEFAAYMLE